MDQTTTAEVVPLTPENHSLLMALLGGAAAAAAGAIAWAVISVVTGLKLGLVAIGIGYLVGYAVRVFGKGREPMFQILGACLSLLGCLAGNLLMVCFYASRHENISLLDVLMGLGLDLSLAVRLIIETFTPMDPLFYGIAVYEGFRFSRAPAPPAAPAGLGLGV